jgi:hypothetical protein
LAKEVDFLLGYNIPKEVFVRSSKLAEAPRRVHLLLRMELPLLFCQRVLESMIDITVFSQEKPLGVPEIKHSSREVMSEWGASFDVTDALFHYDKTIWELKAIHYKFLIKRFKPNKMKNQPY